MAHIRASFGLFGWLKCDDAKAYLRPKSGKLKWSIQIPSFYPVCRLKQDVGSGPELKSMWPRFGPCLLYLVYSWLIVGLLMACLWPKSGKQERTSLVLSFHAVCGPDESVRCGPDLDIRNFAIWAGAEMKKLHYRRTCFTHVTQTQNQET